MDLRLSLPPPSKSWLQVLAELPDEERGLLLDQLEQTTSYHELLNSWWFIGRREQLPPPGDWIIWAIIAGRGFGKTRSGSEWLLNEHLNCPDSLLNYPTGIIAATNEDLKRYCLRGPSGVLSIAPSSFTPRFEPHNQRLVWPNGSETLLFSSEKPERLRGPNLRSAWCDETASWNYLQQCWDNLEFGLRGSDHPRLVITTTPKPKALLRSIIKQPTTIVTGGSTFDNSANLAPTFLKRVKEMYANTAIGEQEIYARLLDEAKGALWHRQLFEGCRTLRTQVPDLARIVVGVDPGHIAGIVVAGVANGTGYVLRDASTTGTPDHWGRAAILAWRDETADSIIVERNHGGEMAESVLKGVAKDLYRAGELPSPHVPVRTVWASRGKYARAEPVSMLYEQGLVSHVGIFPEMEDECCNWVPDQGHPSPNRLDALVWALTDIMVKGRVPLDASHHAEIMGHLSMSEFDAPTDYVDQAPAWRHH